MQVHTNATEISGIIFLNLYGDWFLPLFVKIELRTHFKLK